VRAAIAALKRLGLHPFEVFLGSLALMAGLSGLLHLGTPVAAPDQGLDPLVAVMFLWAYLASGLLLLGGIGASTGGNFEAGGLILLATASLVRAFLLFMLIGWGWDFGLLAIESGLAVWACALRTVQLINGGAVLEEEL
jgi:hypothetical protein